MIGRAPGWPSCWIFDADFVWYYIEDCRPDNPLITNSETGVIHWSAKAQLPLDDPNVALPEEGALHFTYENSGFVCWFSTGVVTTNYNITITPDGKFNINCHFRPDKWQPE
jgi:hypothetical protein